MTNIRELIESTRLEIAEFEKSIPLIEKTQGEHDELNRLINQTQDDESKLLGQHSADIDQQTEKLLEIRARRDVLKSRLNGSVDDCWERSYALAGIAFKHYDRLCACSHQRSRED